MSHADVSPAVSVARRLIGAPVGDARLEAVTPVDRDAMYQLYRSAFEPLAYRSVGGWDDVSLRDRFDARFDVARSMVARRGGAAVALVELEDRGPGVFLRSLAVRPDAQGCGLGTGLVRALQLAAAADAVVLALTVVHANPRALALYRRLGFAETHRDEERVHLQNVSP